MDRSRNFCFTLNNYTDASISQLSELRCKYMCYGKEEGDSGTPHLQGVVIFNNLTTESSARKKLKGCHVEVCKGSIFQNQTYCKKDGDWFERGVAPMTQEEKGDKGGEYWEHMLKAARADDFDAIPAQALIQHGNALRFYRDEESKKRKFEDTEDQMLWYYGGTGTGKSYKARQDYPDAYLKMCNKWWDGYENHEVVLIEDFDKKHDILCHHVKLWADRYPFLAEYKGGAKKIRPKIIIITSNWHPSDIWTDERDLEPIKRRFKIVRFGVCPPYSEPSPFVDPFFPKN